MEIIEIVSLGIVTTIIYLLIKDKQPAIAFLLVLITVVLLFLYLMQYIHQVLSLIQHLGDKANINQLYIKTIIQIIGISYLTEIGSNIVKDAGLESVALKIEMVGKLFILLLAIPIFHSLIETILGIFPLS